MKRFKDNQGFEDDGRTIAEMNVEGMPWYKPHKQNHSLGQQIDLTWAEKKAMFIGIMAELIPMILILALGFTLILLVLDIFWLKG